MTIVTKNSLTLSNVNDGTITHYAYAYSADGTDRFTTTYPNLNLLRGTKTSKSITGNNAVNQGGLLYSFDNNNTLVNQGFSVNDTITLEFDWSATNPASGSFLLQWQGTPWGLNAPTIKLSSTNGSGHVIYTYNIRSQDVASTAVAIGIGYRLDNIPTNTIITFSNVIIRKAKCSQPWMPSSSEVTTADWPSYIGQYTDFTQADSTNPSDYTWSRIRGNDGATGPQGPQGNTGATGPQGPAGSNGNPGKIVSDTEPTTKFKGLTWKYSGTADLTASDGTVILSGTEYYWSGTNWILNSINAHNINGNNLTITDGEFVSTTTNGQVTTSTEIKDNHIAISKTDGTVNTRNDIALDSEQGLAQKFTNINTGFYRTAGINYQGPFTSDSDGNYAQLTPQGTKLSTDVPWTTLSPMGGFSGGLIRFAVKNGVAHFSLAGLSCPPMTAGNWIKCAQLPSGSIAIPSENQVTAAFTNATVWGFYVSKSGGLYLQSTSNSPALNGFVNASNSYPIG